MLVHKGRSAPSSPPGRKIARQGSLHSSSQTDIIHQLDNSGAQQRQPAKPTLAATMLNPHVSVAVAQVVVYAPMLPIAIYVLCKNWKYPPRMAW
jgi:hypothetical protein